MLMMKAIVKDANKCDDGYYSGSEEIDDNNKSNKAVKAYGEDQISGTDSIAESDDDINDGEDDDDNDKNDDREM